MNYWFDNNVLRTSSPGRSVLFHLDEAFHLAILRQTPRIYTLFLVTMSCAGWENNVTGFPPVLICGPCLKTSIPEWSLLKAGVPFLVTLQGARSPQTLKTPWITDWRKNAAGLWFFARRGVSLTYLLKLEPTLDLCCSSGHLENLTWQNILLGKIIIFCNWSFNNLFCIFKSNYINTFKASLQSMASESCF